MEKVRKVRKAIIPVAGLGTRFLPFTKTVPKEMLPILNIPSIHYIIEEAVQSGIEEIIFITSSRKGALVDYLDRDISLENELDNKGKKDLVQKIIEPSKMAKYVFVRQYQALGLGHAVLQAKNIIGDEPFALFLGDDVIYSDKEPVMKQMMKIYEKYGGTVLGVNEVPEDKVSNYGVIKKSDEINEKTFYVSSLVEKPKKEEAPSNLSIMGRYILSPKIFDFLQEKNIDKNTGEIQITDSINKLAQIEKVIAYNFYGRRYDLGSIDGFLEAQIEFALRDKNYRESVKNIIKNELEKELKNEK